MTGRGIDADLVRLLSGWIAGTDVALLELRTADGTVRLLRPGSGRPVPAETPDVSQTPEVVVAAPAVGLYLDRHPLATEPLAREGQAVRTGDVVGLLRVGSLLLHVTAPADGTVTGAFATPGETLGYGATIVRIQPGGAG